MLLHLIQAAEITGTIPVGFKTDLTLPLGQNNVFQILLKYVKTFFTFNHKEYHLKKQDSNVSDVPVFGNRRICQ